MSNQASASGVEKKRILDRTSVEIAGLPQDGRLWRIMWYCGVVRNELAPSEPRVIILAGSKNNGQLSHCMALIGLTQIGLVRIGSRWRNGLYVDDYRYEEFDATVLTADQRLRNPVEVVTLAKLQAGSGGPQAAMGLHTMIETKDDAGTTLLISSFELFWRCFGVSHHLKRTLATSLYADAFGHLIAPDRLPAEDVPPNTQLITVSRDCKLGDGVFLAALKFDSTAQDVVRRLCGSFQIATGRSPFAPNIRTWWSVPLQMRLQGHRLEGADTPTVLVTRINGMSIGPGPSLWIDNQNTSLVADDPNKDVPKPSTLTTSRAVTDESLPYPAPLLHTEEPDQGYESTNVLEDSFDILDTQRNITRVASAEQRGEKIHIVKVPATLESLSGGDPRGAPGGVGSASLFSKQNFPFHDEVARRVFSALINIQKYFVPSIVVTLEAFDGNAFRKSPKPMALEMIKPAEFKGHVWATIKDFDERRARSFFLCRLNIDQQAIYFYDIERRTQFDAERGQRTKTESFCGAAFTAAERSFATALQGLIAETVSRRGILKDINTKSPLCLYRHDKHQATLEKRLREVIASLAKPNQLFQSD